MRSLSTRTPSQSKITSMANHSCLAALPEDAVTAGSVLALDHEERSADGTGKLRLLLRKFEVWRKLGRDFHAIGEFEADGPLLLVIDRVHHVDREAALVEHV